MPAYMKLEDFGYKGVCNDVELLLSEIPEWQIPMCRCNLYYNRNGWGEHCKDYNSYQTWLKERNTQRYSKSWTKDRWQKYVTLYKIITMC